MTKRIFTAIDISDPMRRSAATRIESLRKEFPFARVNWEKAEKLHLTLKFLGEIDDRQLAKLIEAVEQTAEKVLPFELQINGMGDVFPSRLNARVLWLGVKDKSESLRKLSEILEEECEKQGFAKEKRDFRTHLTIARIKQKADKFLIERFLHTVYPPSPPFEVSEIVIYESELKPRGSIYKVISRNKLKTEE